MAKNIDFMGATFPDVPSIRLPQHEGGLVSFDDTTDATATAEDIAQGKTAYVNGQRVTGTASGGSAVIEALNVTTNGTYTAPSGVDGYSPVSVIVPGIVPTGSQTFAKNGTFDVTAIAEAVINVAGGGSGGLEYETGTWTCTENTKQTTINFSNSHTITPGLVIMNDVSNLVDVGTYAIFMFCFYDSYRLWGTRFPSPDKNPYYALSLGGGRTPSNYIYQGIFCTTNSDSTVDDSNTCSQYWVKPNCFMPGFKNASYFFYRDHVYKWIAIWAPTS